MPHLRRAAEGAILGESQVDIASDLGVTRKTLRVYLSHAYGFCGVGSRAELAVKYFTLVIGELEAAVSVWAALAKAQQAKLDGIPK